MSPDLRQAYERLPERIKRYARPSLRIKTTPTPIESLKLGQSRIGGVPDLPPEFEWPHFSGLPLSFITQLNLEEIAVEREVLPLPKHGSLVFFYDGDQRTWGFDPNDRGSAVVVYLSGDSLLARRSLPEGLPDTGRFDCCAVRWKTETSLPDDTWELFDPPLSQEERSLLADYTEEFNDRIISSHYLLGGYANCVQNPMEVECQLVTNGLYCGDASGYDDPRAQSLAKSVNDWRLLLQIDSDDYAGMMWGDMGRLYFWIKESDLRNRVFNKIWLILQCS